MTKTITQYVNQPQVLENIKQTVSDSQAFITTLSSLVANNDALKECDQRSLLSACLVAASLNLPIANSLGFAYILPYNCKEKVVDASGRTVERWVKKAQFQLGYRGLIQLSLRTGEIQTLNVAAVKDGELVGEDVMTGELSFNWLPRGEREKVKTIGYVAFLKLRTGFTKSLYMSVDELNQHALTYSKTYKRGGGVWKDDFDSMASKTVLKLLLAKFAPMTPALARAVEKDQAVVDGDAVAYPDNQAEAPQEAGDRANEAWAEEVESIRNEEK